MKEIIVDSVRWITRKDISKIVRINHFNSPHWSYDEILNNLKQKHCYGFLAEYQDKIVGFAIYEVDKQYIHVINLSVHPDFRRTGIGSQLLAILLDKLGTKRRIIDFIINERHIDFQLFLKTNGFKATEILRKYFNKDDAYVMNFQVEECEDEQNRVLLQRGRC